MTAKPPAARAARRRPLGSLLPALLRERPEFRRYWSAQTISMFGDQISSVALPLTGVLVLRASPAQMGYLTALIWLPSLLFALHAGAWADRFGRRRLLMIAADIGRSALLATVPLCYALHVLTLAQLYSVALGAGTLSVLFTVCDGPVFVAVVPEQRYVEGNSLVYGSRAFSFVGGPAIGGLLVQLLAAPFAIAADALSFLGSAFFLRWIRAAEAPAASGGKGVVTAGARFIASSPIVRASLAAVSVINFFTFGFFALFILYATRFLHVRPGLLGLVLGAGAIGGVLGSLLTGRLARRIGAGRACARHADRRAGRAVGGCDRLGHRLLVAAAVPAARVPHARAHDGHHGGPGGYAGATAIAGVSTPHRCAQAWRVAMRGLCGCAAAAGTAAPPCARAGCGR